MWNGRTGTARALDALVTAGVALGAFWLLSVWSLPTLHPEVWEPVACAAGLRPPENPFYGCYRLALALVFHLLSPAWAMKALPLLAHALVAVATGLVYAVVREVGGAAFAPESAEWSARFRFVWRVAAVAPACVFLGMDPVWRAGQSPTPTTILLPLFAGTVWLFVRFIVQGRLKALYAAALLAGVASGEHLGGIALFGTGMALLWIRSKSLDDSLGDVVDGWRHAHTLTFVWLGAFAVSLVVGIGVFRDAAGVAPDGAKGAFGWVEFVCREGWRQVAGAATPAGWMAGLLGCAGLCAIVVAMYLRAWGKEDFVLNLCGLTFGLLGMMALAQIAGSSPLWRVLEGTASELVPSDSLRTLFLSLAFGAFTLVVAGFVALAVCGDCRWTMVPTLVVLLALPPLALSGRIQAREREMLSVMASYADEVVRETDGRGAIFTDGAFDALVELTAWRKGRCLVALSMMAPNTDRERAIRLRASENDEDADLLQNDASAALRTWVKNDSPRLSRVAVQLGFEFWKGLGRPEPSYAGVAALPGESSEKTVREGGEAADALALRMLEAERALHPFSTGDRALRRLWSFLLWRLSRMHQMRADAADVAGDAARAAQIRKTAERLDAANRELVQMNLGSNWLKRVRPGALTPREGLAVGLARADFAYAADFAEKVLSADPDDARAHFALGMRHLLQRQYAEAERHLLKSLARNPDEPAALNNLANAQFGLGKLNEAEANALKAQQRLPTSEPVRRTLERIRKGKADAARPSFDDL